MKFCALCTAYQLRSTQSSKGVNVNGADEVPVAGLWRPRVRESGARANLLGDLTTIQAGRLKPRVTVAASLLWMENYRAIR